MSQVLVVVTYICVWGAFQNTVTVAEKAPLIRFFSHLKCGAKSRDIVYLNVGGYKELFPLYNRYYCFQLLTET